MKDRGDSPRCVVAPLDHAYTDQAADDGANVPRTQIRGRDDGSEARVGNLGDKRSSSDLEE